MSISCKKTPGPEADPRFLSKFGEALEEFIYIIDDDVGFCESIKDLFQSVGYNVKNYSSCFEFLSSGHAGNPGCLVLDIRLPGLSGLDFQDQLRASGVMTPIVLMTGHGDIAMSVRGMKSGAVDFLPKPVREQDMLDAVAVALQRDAQMREEANKNADLRARHKNLSPREREVMGLVVVGKMNKQIAYDLSLSEITVKIHRSNAMRKLGARNLASFVQMAQAIKS